MTRSLPVRICQDAQACYSASELLKHHFVIRSRATVVPAYAQSFNGYAHPRTEPQKFCHSPLDHGLYYHMWHSEATPPRLRLEHKLTHLVSLRKPSREKHFL
jgi:hypothetical protein